MKLHSLSAFFAAAAAAAAEREEQPVITGTHSDTTNVCVKKPFQIVLDSNPSTGFSWILKKHPEEIRVLGNSYEPGERRSLLLGAGGGHQKFVLEAFKAGDFCLQMTYMQPWVGGDVGQQMSFQIHAEDCKNAKVAVTE